MRRAWVAHRWANCPASMPVSSSATISWAGGAAPGTGSGLGAPGPQQGEGERGRAAEPGHEAVAQPGQHGRQQRPGHRRPVTKKGSLAVEPAPEQRHRRRQQQRLERHHPGLDRADPFDQLVFVASHRNHLSV